MLTEKQKELVELLKGTLPTAPAEVAQNNVDWYPTWIKGEQVETGCRRAWEGVLYEVYAPAGDNLYSPGQVPAVWRRVYLEEWPEWVQPTGAHDAYAFGAKVKHNGKKWTSDIKANTYEPGVYGWTEYAEEA
ncbi:MAG: hypothetical protein MR562_01365 [Clostridiaceae bacterium]|nr:hypothetical protein [Clostridiaceae bacterium]